MLSPAVTHLPREINTAVFSSRVLRIVLGTIATLLTLSVAGQLAKYVFGHDEVFGLVRLTFVTAEGNLPTFYSAIALLTCAVILWCCAQSARAVREPFARHWTALSVIFLYLAVDEAARIHELTGQAMKRVVAFDGFLYYPWVLLGSTAVLVTAVSFFSFVRSLPAPTRRLVVIAAAVFVGGAIGVEMLGARHAASYGTQNLTYALISTVEEACEMLGIALFMYALMRHLESTAAVFVVRFGGAPVFEDAVAPDLCSASLRWARPTPGPHAFEPSMAFTAAAPAQVSRFESV